MVKVKMYRKIQNLKRQGFFKAGVAKNLQIDARTVSKYYDMDEDKYRSYFDGHMFKDKILLKYEREILEVYEQNEFKKLNMSSMYDYLEERYSSLPCNEQTLRNYIGYLIRSGKLRINEELRTYSKVPELPFGKQMQLDFGQYRCSGGLKLYIFAAVLSASRYKYVVFQDHPFKTIEVIQHLLDCFDYFGGIPEEMVIDQDKLMVVSENSGDIIYTSDFKYLIDELDIRMYVCRKNDPETKGKVENIVKYVKRNFFCIRNFKEVEEANKSVFKWLIRRANGKISQATRQIPSLLIDKEREKLRPVINSIFQRELLVGREERNADEKGRISVNACGYQLPSRYRNQTVEVYITKHKVFVFDQPTSLEIVCYDLSLLPGKLISKRSYKREKEKTLNKLKAHVLNLFKGDSWEQFVYRNFKTYPRYVRDQCIEAKRYFQAESINSSVMNQALEYCLENKTPSFLNLYDTYNYFKRDYEMLESTSPKFLVSGITKNHSGVHRNLSVSSRDLKVYKELVNREELGKNESL